MEKFISIEASNLSGPDVLEISSALTQISGGLTEISLKEKKSKGKAELGDVITLAIVLEPLIKAGMEFLAMQFFEWIKRKMSKEKDKSGAHYVFNIYNTSMGGVPMVTSEIDQAQKRVNKIVESYIPGRLDFKGSLFTLLGRGKGQDVLLAIIEARDTLLGQDPNNVKNDALSVLNRIQGYNTSHSITNPEEWDIAFRAEISRDVFECINQL